MNEYFQNFLRRLTKLSRFSNLGWKIQ